MRSFQWLLAAFCLSVNISGQNFTFPDYSVSLNHAPNCYVDSTIIVNSGSVVGRYVSTYDAKWRLVKSYRDYYQIDPDIFNYTYDANDSLIKKEQLQGTSPQYTTVTIFSRNQLKQIEYDSLSYNHTGQATLETVGSYSYDAAGNTSCITWSDNTGSLTSRVVYTRNSGGTITQILAQGWGSNTWQSYYSKTFMYDANNLLMEEITQHGSGGILTNQFKFRYSYSGTHLDTLNIYGWNLGWVPIHRWRYSPASIVDTMASDYWNGSQFIKQRRYIRTTAQGRLTKWEHQENDKGWVNVQKDEFFYDTDGTHTASKFTAFDKYKNQWHPPAILNHYYSCDLTRTGLREETKNKLKVYPNPTRDLVTIESEFPIRSGKVVNTSGQTVIFFEGASVDMRDLVSGIYALQVIFEDGRMEMVKLVKE